MDRQSETVQLPGVGVDDDDLRLKRDQLIAKIVLRDNVRIPDAAAVVEQVLAGAQEKVAKAVNKALKTDLEAEPPLPEQQA